MMLFGASLHAEVRPLISRLLDARWQLRPGGENCRGDSVILDLDSLNEVLQVVDHLT